MTWQLNFIENHQQTGEYCLALKHSKKHTPLRSWFGPMAQHLFQQHHHHFSASNSLQAEAKAQRWAIDKQMAQHLLIQASLFNQRCIHQYQVNEDINNKGLDCCHELSELLLFIRMSAQHPSHQTLLTFVGNQLPCCSELEVNLKALVNAKLIQKISFHHWEFYDKNPYPHDHLLDLNTLKLNDFSRQQKPQEQQLLIRQTP